MNKAINKLEEELKEIKDKRIPADPIANYLIEVCKLEIDFAERVKMKNKSLKRCFDYVFNEVKKKLEGTSGWMEDDEVYKIAETYWLLNITDLKDIEIKDTKINKETEKTDVKDKDIITTDKKLKAKEEVKAILDNQQVSIFDMMG